MDAPNSSGATREELISKLLEDSLRKARENGEILDEGSGEAILKILKQSLLKSSESPTSPETTSSSGYFRSSCGLKSMFLEENAYEVIKEPIYEEIPDEPPPLPLSPPPTEDFLKGRIFFGDEYKDSFRGNIMASFECLVTMLRLWALLEKCRTLRVLVDRILCNWQAWLNSYAPRSANKRNGENRNRTKSPFSRIRKIFIFIYNSDIFYHVLRMNKSNLKKILSQYA